MAYSSNKESKRFSRECIYRALIELLGEKEYEKITLTEIAERAGLSRNAVYRNFEYKDNIIDDYLFELTENRINEASSTLTTKEDILSMFQFLYDSKDIIYPIYNAGLVTSLYKVFIKSKDLYMKNKDRKADFMNSYFLGGLFAVYLNWMEKGFVETPEEMTDMAVSMLKEYSLLGRK